MRINSGISRARRLSLTSLIDVIFLLLLFFMLSSTFTRFAEVEISAGHASTGPAGTPDVLVRLGENSWQVNGIAFADPEAVAAEVARLEAAGAQSAVLLVREAGTSQQLVGAVEAIQRRTGLTLSVAH